MSRNLGPHLALLAAALLAFTSCGGDSDDADDNDSGSESRVGSSAPEESGDGQDEEPEATEVDPADQAIADAALLTLQDFPPGWEAVPASGDDGDRESREEIASCVGVSYDDLYNDGNAEAESPDFTSENDEEVSVQVTVGSSDKRMATAFEIASRSEFAECVAEGIAEAVDESAEDADEDVEAGEITVNQMSFGSYGDETLAFRTTIPVSVDGFNFEATGDFVIVRIGRAQAAVTSFGLGSTLSTDEFSGYVELAAQRLTDALAASE